MSTASRSKKSEPKIYYFEQAISLLERGMEPDHPLFIHIAEMSGEKPEDIVDFYDAKLRKKEVDNGSDV